MRNIKNCNSSPLQFVDNLEKTSYFADIQCGRWLIHRNDSKLHRERLGNLDQLPIANAQIADPLTQGHIEPQFTEYLGGVAFDLAPIEQTYSDYRLATQKNVFCDRKLRNQVEFLGDSADAGLLCLNGTGKNHLLLPRQIFPDVGRRSPLMMLINVLLPAPFSPINA